MTARMFRIMSGEMRFVQFRLQEGKEGKEDVTEYVMKTIVLHI